MAYLLFVDIYHNIDICCEELKHRLSFYFESLQSLIFIFINIIFINIEISQIFQTK